MTDDSKTFREAVERVKAILEAVGIVYRTQMDFVRHDLAALEADKPAPLFEVLNALPTILDLADEALAHRDAQDAIGDWLERVEQFEADVRRIEQASEDRGIDWLHDLLCDVDYPGQPPEGVMP